MEFEAVIGLEIHAQLATKSKLFCSCSTEFGKEPNENTCPVCLGLPGVLPRLNEKAIEFAIKMGIATNCEIRLDSEFSRKNYFYPDLPKAYQTTQFDKPVCENGHIFIDVKGERKRINITRIHIEEDAGKLVHNGEDPKASYVDLNRAGIPLIEIVSEPEMRNSDEAKAYMEKMHSIVTYIEASHGDMEKGNLRCDANVSLREVGVKPFGTRTETKNLNSFRYLQQAIDYEIERQANEIDSGETIIQETRLWNVEKKETYSMRIKENADDYRYFPCPDLPIAHISKEKYEEIKKSLPELPDEKKERFIQEFNLNESDASILVANKQISIYFEKLVKEGVESKLATNWIMGEVSKKLNEEKVKITDFNIQPSALAALLQEIKKGTINGKIAKTVFEEMFISGKSAQEIIKEKGLEQVSDTGELTKICEEIVANNPTQREEYLSGKDKLFGFFVGQAMKATKGKANPQIINQTLQSILKK